MKFKLLKRLAAPARAGLFCAFALLLSNGASIAGVTVNLTPGTIGTGYTGTMTVAVSNLSAGGTVLVQKYLDINSNGAVDAGDWLVQQFSVVDGQGPPVIGGVTNINVPGDMDSTANGTAQIQLEPVLGGPEQLLSGQYLYVISSPTAAFTAITNTVIVTNTDYGQSFSGSVTYNGTNVPNAIVWLAASHQAGDTSSGLNLLSGVVADGSGNYSLSAPVGEYRLVASASGFIVNLDDVPTVDLTSGSAIESDLALTVPTPLTISGALDDSSNSSEGLPGVLMVAEYYTNDIGPIGFGTSDSNGNYALPVHELTEYNVNAESLALDVLGHVGLTGGAQTTVYEDNISGLQISSPMATALIYGRVVDTNGDPLPGVAVKADNGVGGPYVGAAKTDQNGQYVVGVTGGNWSAAVKSQDLWYAGYLFSTGPTWTYNNGGAGTNLNAGMVAQANFTGIPAPFQINGSVGYPVGDSIAGVTVTATAMIGGVTYIQKTTLDGANNFTFTVPGGNWEITFDCDALNSLDYECLGSRLVSVTTGSVTISVEAPRLLPPAIPFSATPTNGVVPVQVAFSAPATDSYGEVLTNWYWEFGDGGTSTNPSPTHTYNDMNVYHPTLYVTDTNGDPLSTIGPTIDTYPVVLFTATPDEGPAELTVQFQSPATNSYGEVITSWYWDFGDGEGSSTNQNPIYTYTSNGNYTPTLYVTDNNDDEIDTYGPSISVAPFSGLVLNGSFETGDFTGWTTLDNSDVGIESDTNHTYLNEYSASFGAVGYLGYISQTIATKPGATYMLSFWLDSPDGGTPNEFSTLWNRQVVLDLTNIPAIGWTNIQLLVTATSNATLLQFGGRDDPAYFYLDGIDVESNFLQFSANPTSGPAALTAQFNASSADSNTNTITNWSWNFGDGTTALGQNPSHTFTNTGLFSPVLTALNILGQTVPGFGPSIAVGSPTAQVTAYPTSGAPPLAVSFNTGNDTYGYAITNWLWDFDENGATSTDPNPTYIYNDNGAHHPTLTAIDSGGNQLVVDAPEIDVAQSEGLVLNGGFETADFTGWFLSGDTTDTYVFDSDDLSHGGRYFAALVTSGNGQGSLSQTLSTVPGDSYVLSFWLNAPCGETPSEFAVSWNGNTILDVTNVMTRGWSNMQFTVTATSSETDLEFTFLDTNNYLGLDDVSAQLSTNTVLTWAAPAPITYGTALNSAQLDATADVPGTFSYTPTNGTVLDAGAQTLTVVFMPTDTNDYSNATNTVGLDVLPAPLTVTVSNATRGLGLPNPSFAGSISGLVNGDDITATFVTTATSNSPAGTYPITPVLDDPGERLSNYSVTTNAGTLSVIQSFSAAVMGTSNLLGFWPFTTNSQANSVVNGYTGAFQGEAAVGPAGSGPALLNTPNNTAVILDGNGSFVNTSLVGDLTNDQGTMVGWFQLTNLPSLAGRTFTIAGESQTGNDFDLQIDTDNEVHFYTDSGGSVAGTNALTTNDFGVWHFVAATFTASVSRDLYLDGALVAANVPGAHAAPGTGAFAMGASDVFTGRFFAGALADVAVFNRQLTGAEISNFYASAVSAGVTITFDDLTSEIVPNGYYGLNWSNFAYEDGLEEGIGGYAYGMISSPNVAYNEYGTPATISSATPFTLTSGYFTAAWNDGLTLEIIGSSEGTTVYDLTNTLVTTSPLFISFPNVSVTQVVFQSSGGVHNPNYGGSGTQFALDNLTINGSGIGVVNTNETLSWSAPAPIGYGTALSGAQLDAAANVPGNLVYTPTNGAVLDAGTRTLSVTFTPSNINSYVVLTREVPLTVLPAALVVTASNATMSAGQSVPALTGSIGGLVNGDDITAAFVTTATSSSPPGAYTITPVLSDPGGRLTNYSVTTNFGTLTVALPVIVAITSPSNGLSFTTNQSLAFSATASAAGGLQGIALFTNSALAATNAGANVSVTLTNLTPGALVLTAVATDSNNLTASATVYVTVTAAGTALIDFDALAAGAGPVGGSGLSNYLAGYGVSIGAVSFGTRLQAVNQNTYSGHALPAPSSPPNLLTQAGSSQPVSFTLNFAAPLQSLSFTRVAVQTNNGSASVSHPAWTAQLLDASGNVEASSVSEPLLTSPTNIPARTFTLTGSNIAGVRFSSDSQQTAAFPAVLLDDLLLNANTNTGTNALSISLAAGGGPFISPANVTLTATAGDGYGANYDVAFYAGGALIGTSAGGTLVWSNVLNGTYLVAAQIIDSNGYALLSTNVTVTVRPPANSTVINFDALTAPASGAALAAYLGLDEVGLGAGAAGATVVAESQAQPPLAGLALASSPPNLLTETGLNGAMSYTLAFSNWLTQVSFTRPELLGTNPFVTHPAWQVTAYDATGNALATVQSPLLASFTNVPAQIYTLSGNGIASLAVSSDGSGLTSFPAMLLDDLILTEGTSVVVTNPASGQVFNNFGPIALGAGTAAQAGVVTNVNFYVNGALAGAAQASPFATAWTAPSNGVYAVTAVAQNSSGVVVASAPVNITVASGFAILTPPASQTIAQGAGATLSVVTTTNNATYQWQSNNAALPGATGSSFTLSNAAAGTFNYTVVAASGGQSITSAPAVLTVLAPPALTPVAFTPTNVNITNIAIGQTVTMTESNTGPVTYQWRLNGTGIAGATDSFYTISNAQPLNSGNYQVVVANTAAFSVSPTFPVAVNIGSNALGTSNAVFANAMVLNPNPLVGLPAGGNNSNSPAQDPLVSTIAGKAAGNFLWYSWTPTNSGNVSLTTRGSSFDTLLGVYTTNVGTPAGPSDLTTVAADDDSGGFFTSLVSFNATSNITYEIAVAGYHGASGTVILGLPSASSYNLGQSAPVITEEPQSQLAQPGATVTLSVMATNAASYQWYFAGAPVAGVNTNVLVITNFPASAAGNYWGLAQNAAGTAQSQTAVIELATNGQSLSTPTNLSVDKFDDAVDLAGNSETHYRREDAGGDTGGFTLSQSFSTLGATKEEGEPNHAGQPGGASYWYSYTAPTGGNLQFDTSGSAFNTILAVYTGPGDSFSTLVSAGSAYTTNYLRQGQPVVLVSNVTAATRFFIAIDGYLGASGAAKLNVSFTQISNTVINTNLPTLITTNHQAAVAINYPANGYATTNPLITVRGVVRGLLGLQVPLASSVQLSVNNNAAGPVELGATNYASVLTAGPGGVEEAVAQETIAWSTNLILAPGPNLITVQGLSIQGASRENATPPVTHTIYLIEGSSPLTLRTNGSGRLTGLPHPASLEVGRNYTITAAPSGGWVLTDWTSGTNIDALTNLSDVPDLTFTMFSNMVLQANFGPNPFPAVAGVYDGLFSPSNGVTEASSGFLTATLPPSSRGAYSAKILLDGGSYPFNGAFTAEGASQKTVNRAGKTPLTIDLQLGLSPTNNQLTGQISGSDGNNNWVSQLQAGRALFNTRTNPARYTLILPPGDNTQSNQPGGIGYATLSENAAGRVTLNGRLGDGAAASQSVLAATNGAIPLYLSLYSLQGSLQGWLTLTNLTPNTPTILGTNLTWIKLSSPPGTLYPEGFTNTHLAILGSSYTPPAAGGNVLTLTSGTLTLSNEDLNGLLIYSNLAIVGNKLINNNPAGNPTNELSGTVNPANGILTLTYRPTGARANTTAKGVVLQDTTTTNAAGPLPAQSHSGYFLLQQ